MEIVDTANSNNFFYVLGGNNQEAQKIGHLKFSGTWNGYLIVKTDHEFGSPIVTPHLN